MSKESLNTITYPLFGSLTAIGFGAIFFQLIGALFLGVFGAIGGWLAKEFVIPYLNKLVNKYFQK